MSIYAVWNNKGAVGKSYLTFQLATEYARQHPNKKVLVVDLCPQANASSMLLGGLEKGEVALNQMHTIQPRKTISGYIEDRISSPYFAPKTGANFVTQVSIFNKSVTNNLYLVVGDELLETQSSRVSGATNPGPPDAWRVVHLWIKDLIDDIQTSWDQKDTCVFVDCNPSFSVYTELALTAADDLIIPFSADGSSRRAIRAVLALVYGIPRYIGDPQSDFYINTDRYRMALPKIYMYIGNRLTQMNNSSASAFRTVVTEIGQEIWSVWRTNPNLFRIHPSNAVAPTTQSGFRSMFQYEVNDANTASVVSGALGIPIATLNAGSHSLASRKIIVNQTQLDKQVPNIIELVRKIQ